MSKLPLPVPKGPRFRRMIVAFKPGRAPHLPGPLPLQQALPKQAASGVRIRSAFRTPALKLARAGRLVLGGVPADHFFLLEGADPGQVGRAMVDLWRRGDLAFSAPVPPLPSRLRSPKPVPEGAMGDRAFKLPCPGGGDPEEPYQGYRHLDSDPFTGLAASWPHWGVGASQVEDQTWGRGQGARLRVLERGWYLKGTAATPFGCPDLEIDDGALFASPSGLDIAGGHGALLGDLESRQQDWRDHGLLNLCILAATPDNCFKLRGLVPDADIVLHGTCGSPAFELGTDEVGFDPYTAAQVDLYTALVETWNSASHGDIVLIEEQVLVYSTSSTGPDPDTLGPIEMDPLCWLLLAAIGQKGVTVIEPSGDGLSWLNDLVWPLCDPDSMSAISDRPIMVSGADPVTKCRDPNLNAGLRVDAFAWGNQVRSISFHPGSKGWDSVGDFSGTSPAAAIVAGSATIVQAMAKAGGLGLLGPSDLRTLLLIGGTATDGTCKSGAQEHIGLMPNLQAVGQFLGLI